jgi:two-component system response regulator HydG
VQVGDLPSPIQNVNHHIPPEAVEGPKIVPIAELEKQAILRTIDQLKGDKLLAARLLGIGKTTLYRKLKEFAIQD